jgi:hypothetical protein
MAAQERKKMTIMDRFVLRIRRYNREHPPVEIRKEKTVFGFRFVFNWRSKNNLWGRFGGGWNWKFGFQAGGSSIIFDLLICSLRITKAARLQNQASAQQPHGEK